MSPRNSPKRKSSSSIEGSPPKYAFLRITRKLIEGIIAIEIEIESPDAPSFLIKNLSNYFSIGYYQSGCGMEQDYLDCQSSAPYTWTDFSKTRSLVLQFYQGGINLRPIFNIRSGEMEIALDQLNQRKKLLIPYNKHKGRTLFITTHTDGYTKILTISDTPTSESEFGGEGTDQASSDFSFRYFLEVSIEKAHLI